MSLLERVNTPEEVKKLNNSELLSLSEEIRNFLVESVFKSGGHLASNLGVVEITLALLKIFDFPKDKVIFDVGHQCYVYKILTGRYKEFSTLRHLGGISGFPKTNESEYDFFDVGHAGTAISAALGMARARDLNGGDEHIIAVVGDGSLTSGMCFEAINDVGSKKTKLIIILNDNDMAINKNVGGLSSHLTGLRFSKKYVNTKNGVQRFLDRFGKAGSFFAKGIRYIKEKIKYAAIATPVFEGLGLTYMGIIDGNNIEDMMEALKKAKQIDGPVLIHTFTKKGLGYTEAENNPSKFHGITGGKAEVSKQNTSYDLAFSEIICKLAKENKNIVAITAAMASGCGLEEFSKLFSERFFDVAIAEEHAVTMSAGLAKGGYVPVVCLYSTFIQRSFDQIIHDVCLQNLHVVFAIGHAGLTGEDGETHQGLMDLSMFISIPNMTVLAPSSYEEFKTMMEYAIYSCKGPVAIRYPKDQVSLRQSIDTVNPLKAEIITEGNEILLLSSGRMTDIALSVASSLKEDGISSSVVNIRSIKPLDKETLEGASKGKKLIVTLEDGIKDGGMGEYIISNISHNAKVLKLGFDTPFIQHGTQRELFEVCGLDEKSVYRKVKEYYTNEGMA